MTASKPRRPGSTGPQVTAIVREEVTEFPAALSPWGRAQYAALMSEFIALHAHRPLAADALVIGAAVHQSQSALRYRVEEAAALAAGDLEEARKNAAAARLQEVSASARLVAAGFTLGSLGSKKSKSAAARTARPVAGVVDKWPDLRA